MAKKKMVKKTVKSKTRKAAVRARNVRKVSFHAKPMRRTENSKGVSTIIESHVLDSAKILTLSAGIVTMVMGIIFAIANYISYGMGTQAWLAVTNIVLGFFMLLCVPLLYHQPKESAIFILFLSVMTLILPPNGFVFGPIFGIMAGVLVLVKSRNY